MPKLTKDKARIGVFTGPAESREAPVLIGEKRVGYLLRLVDGENVGAPGNVRYEWRVTGYEVCLWDTDEERRFPTRKEALAWIRSLGKAAA